MNTGSLPVPDPGADHIQTHDSGQIRAVTNQEYGKTRDFQESPYISTANTFLPCGLAISSRGLTSISSTTVKDDTALDKSFKWPK